MHELYLSYHHQYFLTCTEISRERRGFIEHVTLYQHPALPDVHCAGGKEVWRKWLAGV